MVPMSNDLVLAYNTAKLWLMQESLALAAF